MIKYMMNMFIFFQLCPYKKSSDLFGLEIVDVQHQITHGGSMRYFIGRKNVS